ncbi:GNAT family N-acetyltransferase [Gilliamella sp. B2776]|uniref:GNAT family N-acetyltransferase n=1 Tax=unclassified Gilliamella TaxID=2685620 RepID=UPI002269C7E0|nr:MULTISPECIES: GNAT family N-acetyltransferase [unclassified Gilliamella]MCX8650401.1 GNAT family N-acetyltransferase [Gilliamella sp. B2779]MCX8654626.1 GNAT family N-acetyltransferase [Gilliamella sp. B2737]MCX8656667.1 GNAT family N-acetyltransferase [Gilliamella sp. B2894]MCX8692174.1 GNAT family N-acetyltransferase [Gilliamella sp. B2776]MCX8694287.1 GNAT family N-acetyltransferase [Gilliamella sp. B2881]
MNFRLINQSDISAYQTLLHNAYQMATNLGIHFAAASVNYEQITHHMECNAVYLSEKGGELVSTLSIRFPWGNNPGPYGLPHLGWFATDPKYKGKGYGNQLWDWVEQQILINQLKLPAVTLGTAQNHPWLVQMYIKKGFRPIGQADLTMDHTTIYFEKIFNQHSYTEWKNRNYKK